MIALTEPPSEGKNDPPCTQWVRGGLWERKRKASLRAWSSAISYRRATSTSSPPGLCFSVRRVAAEWDSPTIMMKYESWRSVGHPAPKILNMSQRQCGCRTRLSSSQGMTISEQFVLHWRALPRKTPDSLKSSELRWFQLRAGSNNEAGRPNKRGWLSTRRIAFWPLQSGHRRRSFCHPPS
jgi:hypothetical protein